MVAKFVQIADDLRARVRDGQYAEGAVLPRQSELATEFDVNVNTVSAALKLLEREGLVQSRRSQGTVVLPQIPLRKVGMDRYSRRNWESPAPVEDGAPYMDERGWQPAAQSTEISIEPATEEMAERLEIDEGEDVVRRARVIRDARGTVTHTLVSYYPHRIAKGTLLMSEEQGPAGRGGAFRVLTDLGYEPHSINERLHARLPDGHEAQVLEMGIGEPIVEMRRRTDDGGGVPLEYAIGLHRASRFQWNYTFEIPE